MQAERSLVDVVSAIFGNLQDIVSAEIRLAKVEVTDVLRNTKSTALGLGIALLASAFSALFLLLAAMHALTLVLTAWGAALVLAGAMALVSFVAFAITLRRTQVRRSIAPRTRDSIKENLAWAKQSIK